jgi:pyruvate formate lyase activating enzyme
MARVVNVERFSSEDGPGIRTVVFFKGCFLRCAWCANPESQRAGPEILHLQRRCNGCRRCLAVCPAGAISVREDGALVSEVAKCRLCLACVDACYQAARILQGNEYTLEALTELVLRDYPYYATSGGGVTLSGGEPLLQADFVSRFATALREQGVGTWLETAGAVPRENLEQAAPLMQGIYFDCKHVDPGVHRQLTGLDNHEILENLRWLDANYQGFLAVRYPVIPSLNDQPEALAAFVKLAASLKRVKEVWFLPYHRLGKAKYQGLGRLYALADTQPLAVRDLKYLNQYQSDLAVPLRM